MDDRNIILDQRYRLLEMIGDGGMARVYRAHDAQLDRIVAVKLLHPTLEDQADVMRRFEREARLVARLSHPHIVAIHDVGRDGETRYLVMEYVASGSLRRLLRAGPLPLAQVVTIMEQLGQALDVAHAQGVVHRDIKPENVLLTAAGEVKVSDFGIAHALSQEDHATTGTTGLMFGSVAYVSPEQALGEPVTARSDVYSSGVMLYEMLTGQPPFAGTSALATAMAHLTQDAAPPRALTPGLPAGVDAVTLRALDKASERRYPSGAALSAALAEAVEDGAVPVYAPTPAMAVIRRGPAPELSGATAARAGRRGRPSVARTLGTRRLTATATFLLLGAGTIYAVQGRQHDATSTNTAQAAPAPHAAARGDQPAGDMTARRVGALQAVAPRASTTPVAQPPTPLGRPARRQMDVAHTATPPGVPAGTTGTAGAAGTTGSRGHGTPTPFSRVSAAVRRVPRGDVRRAMAQLGAVASARPRPADTAILGPTATALPPTPTPTVPPTPTPTTPQTPTKAPRPSGTTVLRPTPATSSQKDASPASVAIRRRTVRKRTVRPITVTDRGQPDATVMAGQERRKAAGSTHLVAPTNHTRPVHVSAHWTNRRPSVPAAQRAGQSRRRGQQAQRGKGHDGATRHVAIVRRAAPPPAPQAPIAPKSPAVAPIGAIRLAPTTTPVPSASTPMATATLMATATATPVPTAITARASTGWPHKGRPTPSRPRPVATAPAGSAHSELPTQVARPTSAHRPSGPQREARKRHVVARRGRGSRATAGAHHPPPAPAATAPGVNPQSGAPALKPTPRPTVPSAGSSAPTAPTPVRVMPARPATATSTPAHPQSAPAAPATAAPQRATSGPPSRTPEPSNATSDASKPPTAIHVPPTDAPKPPTATAVPPTATPEDKKDKDKKPKPTPKAGDQQDGTPVPNNHGDGHGDATLVDH